MTQQPNPPLGGDEAKAYGSSASRIPTELVERLEVAERGSHVLDAELWCARNGYTFVQWDGAGCVYRERPESSIRHIRHSDIAPVTTSLDAALALAERLGLDPSEVLHEAWRLVVHKHHLHMRRYDGPAFAGEVARHACIAILTATTANSVGTDGREAAGSEPS